MTFQEAIAAICCVDGVAQEMVDALEEGLADVERERDELCRRADLAQSDLRLCQSELNTTKGRLDYYEKRAAQTACDLPF